MHDNIKNKIYKANFPIFEYLIIDNNEIEKKLDTF